MNENLSVEYESRFQIIPGDYQKEWRIEKERRRKQWKDFMLEGERQLHDPSHRRDYTDRLLRRASKGLKSLQRALSPDGLAHTLMGTRKDKRRMKKNLRKRARQLEILTQRGETSALGQGITKTGALTTVVAAK